MLHYIVIALISLFILGCIIVLFKIKPEDAPRKLPQDLQERAEHGAVHTHFYETVKPGQGLPPVPGRHRSSEPQTTIMPAIQGQAGRTDTAFIPAIRQQ
jgi:hypothetical protein